MNVVSLKKQKTFYMKTDSLAVQLDIVKMSSINDDKWIVVISQSQKRFRKIIQMDDRKCSFCKRSTNECDGDHGDEMRDISRQQRIRFKH